MTEAPARRRVQTGERRLVDAAMPLKLWVFSNRSIQVAFGLASAKNVRYAIVSVSDIVQEAMLPGVEHTRNSEVVAFKHLIPRKPSRLAGDME